MNVQNESAPIWYRQDAPHQFIASSQLNLIPAANNYVWWAFQFLIFLIDRTHAKNFHSHLIYFESAFALSLIRYDRLATWRKPNAKGIFLHVSSFNVKSSAQTVADDNILNVAWGFFLVAMKYPNKHIVESFTCVNLSLHSV